MTSTPFVRALEQRAWPGVADSSERSAAELLSEILPLLVRQVRSFAGPRADLDDLVQMAAERALKSLPSFEGRSALSTWTYAIAYRTVRDRDRWFRRWRRRFSHESEVPNSFERPTDARHADALLVQKARAHRLHEALDQLPATKRAVVVLHDLEDVPLAEVAEITGANINTVKSRLRDARKKLAQLLADDPLFDRGGCP